MQAVKREGAFVLYSCACGYEETKSVGYDRTEQVFCPKCSTYFAETTKHKIIRTHGKKSRGYKVCKGCGEIIK